MKTRFLIPALFILLSVTHVFAQTLTPEQISTIKKVSHPETIMLPDSAIVYPVRGMVEIHTTNNFWEGEIAVVELWIIDSEGKLVYNNVTGLRTRVGYFFDPDYSRIMQHQGMHLIEDRNDLHIVTAHLTDSPTH